MSLDIEEYLDNVAISYLEAKTRRTGFSCTGAVAEECYLMASEMLKAKRTALQQQHEEVLEQEESEAMRMLQMLDYLRSEEGDSVELLCPNPEFEGAAQAIECHGEWVRSLNVDEHHLLGKDWLRVEAETMGDCIVRACEARRSTEVDHQ